MDIHGIGITIRRYRKLKGLTQEELAEKVNVSTMSIRRYESGERIANEDILSRIAIALDTSLDNIMDGPGVGISDEEVEQLRDEIKDLRFSLGKIGLIKARNYMLDLMYNSENLPEDPYGSK